jgi:hypothetical protein
MKGKQLSRPLLDGGWRPWQKVSGNRKEAPTVIHLDGSFAPAVGGERSLTQGVKTCAASTDFGVGVERLDNLLCLRLDISALKVTAVIQVNADVRRAQLPPDPVDATLAETAERLLKTSLR